VQNKPSRFAACRRGAEAAPGFGRKIMPLRLKKFIGTILIIVLVLVYAVLATTIASLTLATSPWWVHLLYFFLSGLLWILPAMLIIKWMAGPKAGRR
jgi:carbon starvation protein CstA